MWLYVTSLLQWAVCMHYVVELTGITTVHHSWVSRSGVSSWIAVTVPWWIQWPVVLPGGGVWKCWLDWCYEVLSAGLQFIAGLQHVFRYCSIRQCRLHFYDSNSVSLNVMHWRHQLWGTGAHSPPRLLTILTSEPHKVYNSQLCLVPYSILLWKRMKSATRGILLYLESTKVFLSWSSARDPARTVPLTPCELGTGEQISSPILHPINAFGISVLAPRFMPLHQILTTPLIWCAVYTMTRVLLEVHFFDITDFGGP